MTTRTKPRRSLADLLGDEPSPLDKIGKAVELLGDESGDTSNGFAFMQRYKDEVRYVPEIDTWVAVDRGIWSPVDPDILMQTFCAERVANAARRFEGAERGDIKEAKRAVSRSAMMFDDRRQQERALKQARPHVSLSFAMFDQNPYLLAVANGVIDLKTGGLVEARRDQYLMRRAPVEFQPGAECPAFMRYMETVQPDPAMRAFLQRAAGYTLTGDVSEEKFFFAHGEASTGKSLFVGVLAAMLGPFTVNIPAQHLTASKYPVDPERVHARLVGARFALSNETREGAVWNEVLIKELSAYDRASARDLYKSAVDYQPTHKLWIRGNHVPGSLDSSDGLSRRYTPVAFETVIPEGERDPGLLNHIKTHELSGVLNWALAGARLWSRDRALGLDGLRIPPRVKAERDNYKAESDWFGRWLSECTESKPGDAAWTATQRLYDSYRRYCHDGGLTPLSKIAFGRTMQARGFVQRNANQKKPSHYRGLSLVAVRDERFGDHGDE